MLPRPAVTGGGMAYRQLGIGSVQPYLDSEGHGTRPHAHSSLLRYRVGYDCNMNANIGPIGLIRKKNGGHRRWPQQEK